MDFTSSASRNVFSNGRVQWQQHCEHTESSSATSSNAGLHRFSARPGGIGFYQFHHKFHGRCEQRFQQ
jgi:hypothetical protein